MRQTGINGTHFVEDMTQQAQVFVLAEGTIWSVMKEED